MSMTLKMSMIFENFRKKEKKREKTTCMKKKRAKQQQQKMTMRLGVLVKYSNNCF